MSPCNRAGRYCAAGETAAYLTREKTVLRGGFLLRAAIKGSNRVQTRPLCSSGSFPAKHERVS